MYLFLFIVLIALPGIFFSERKWLTALAVCIATAIGCFIVPQTSLLDDFLAGVQELHFSLMLLLYAGLISIFLGPFVAMLHMLLYYTVWKNRANDDFIKLEQHYFTIGLGRRIWTYALSYEVIFRFGLFSAIYYALSFITSDFISIIAATLCSTILFVWWTWQSLQKIGTQHTTALATYLIISYSVLGICTAYAFTLSGFLTALFIHLQFHLLWFPVQALMRAQRNGTLEH